MRGTRHRPSAEPSRRTNSAEVRAALESKQEPSAKAAASATVTMRTNSLELLLLRGPSVGVGTALDDLRYHLLTDGIPSKADGMSDLRIYVWLILLNAGPIRTDVYLDLVRQGPSPAYSKIRNDTFRTMATDPLFRRRVTENSLTRVLNAVAWRAADAHEARVNGWLSPRGTSPVDPHGPLALASSLSSAGAATTAAEVGSDAGAHAPAAAAAPVGYVQGMNVLAAPFLYVARSEVEAFVAFDTFISIECPAYMRGGTMDGVHRGLALVDRVLALVDPRLAAHLQAKGLHAEIYAFASLLTMCACTPPLPEVLALWDFLLAWGPHLNILCVVAQLVLMRDAILASSSPNQLLRSFPPLQAAKIKAVSISFVSKIPDTLYNEILTHAK